MCWMNIWFEASKMILLCSVVFSCFLYIVLKLNNQIKTIISFVFGFKAFKQHHQKLNEFWEVAFFSVFLTVVKFVQWLFTKSAVSFLVSRGFWLKKTRSTCIGLQFYVAFMSTFISIDVLAHAEPCRGLEFHKIPRITTMPICVKLWLGPSMVVWALRLLFILCFNGISK